LNRQIKKTGKIRVKGVMPATGTPQRYYRMKLLP